MKQNKNVFYYIVLSIIAAVLLLALAIFVPSETITIYDKLFVGGAFIGSCIFGISLAKNPGWLRRFTKHVKKSSNNKQSKKVEMGYKGHHPDCGTFQSHTIVTKNKTYCAGCLGLTIGSLISIISIILYIFLDVQSTIFHYFISFGLIIIFLTYLEIMLPIRNALIKIEFQGT